MPAAEGLASLGPAHWRQVLRCRYAARPAGGARAQPAGDQQVALGVGSRRGCDTLAPRSAAFERRCTLGGKRPGSFTFINAAQPDLM